MGHRLRFKQLASVQPFEAALGERRPSRVEVSPDRFRIGAADPARIGAEALVPNRAKIVGVGIENVLPAHLACRVEEREPDAERNLEQRSPLPLRFGNEPAIGRGQLGRRRQALRVRAQIRERPPEPLDLERRDVDEPRCRSARALEGGEEVVDGRESGPACQDARCLELGDERVEVDASPARHVGGAGEQPERGEPEGEDRAEFEDVPARLAHGEPFRGALELLDDLVVRAFYASDQLDGDAEEVARRRLVQRGIAARVAGGRARRSRAAFHRAPPRRRARAARGTRGRTVRAGALLRRGVGLGRHAADRDRRRRRRSRPGSESVPLSEPSAGLTATPPPSAFTPALDAPFRRNADRHPAEQRVHVQMSAGRQLRLAQVDRDPAEP